jgi:hypothetical protein
MLRSCSSPLPVLPCRPPLSTPCAVSSDATPVPTDKAFQHVQPSRHVLDTRSGNGAALYNFSDAAFLNTSFSSVKSATALQGRPFFRSNGAREHVGAKPKMDLDGPLVF